MGEMNLKRDKYKLANNTKKFMTIFAENFNKGLFELSFLDNFDKDFISKYSKESYEMKLNNKSILNSQLIDIKNINLPRSSSMQIDYR